MAPHPKSIAVSHFRPITPSNVGDLGRSPTVSYGDTKPRGGRGERASPQSYFEVAFGLLAEGGIKAVTIANLCERLRVTKGSFYHHFRSGPDFQQQLLDHWQNEHLARRSAQVDAVADPRD